MRSVFISKRLQCTHNRSNTELLLALPPSLPLCFMKMNTKIIVTSFTFILGATLSLAAPVAENWEEYCAKCHGEDGRGKTKKGRILKLKDYSDAAVQSEMTDEDIIRITTEGFTNEAGKEKMKAFADDLSAEEIRDFVAFIRAMKR